MVNENNSIVVDKAFIASNKYIKKEIIPEGAGVLVSYDEEIEKSETKKTDKFASSIWFEINIPKKDYLLHMDLPMREQPDQILQTLLSNDALAFLFRGEGIDMDKKVKQYIVDTSVPEDKKFDTYTREMKTWYDMKRNQIMVLDSGLQYMELVVSRTVKKDIEVASAYMDKFGAFGSLYKDKKGERVIIYDPHTKLILGTKHAERAAMSLSA